MAKNKCMITRAAVLLAVSAPTMLVAGCATDQNAITQPGVQSSSPQPLGCGDTHTLHIALTNKIKEPVGLSGMNTSPLPNTGGITPWDATVDFTSKDIAPGTVNADMGHASVGAWHGVYTNSRNNSAQILGAGLSVPGGNQIAGLDLGVPCGGTNNGTVSSSASGYQFSCQINNNSSDAMFSITVSYGQAGIATCSLAGAEPK